MSERERVPQPSKMEVPLITSRTEAVTNVLLLLLYKRSRLVLRKKNKETFDESKRKTRPEDVAERGARGGFSKDGVVRYEAESPMSMGCREIY